MTVYKRMPPGHPELTGDERQALVACLREEHYGSRGAFKRWLLQDNCWNALP